MEISRIGSFHYEKLKGDKKGISSIRVSDKYRIEFEEWSDCDEKNHHSVQYYRTVKSL